MRESRAARAPLETRVRMAGRLKNAYSRDMVDLMDQDEAPRYNGSTLLTSKGNVKRQFRLKSTGHSCLWHWDAAFDCSTSVLQPTGTVCERHNCQQWLAKHDDTGMRLPPTPDVECASRIPAIPPERVRATMAIVRILQFRMRRLQSSQVYLGELRETH